jgi:hypothetical protein
MTVAAVLSVPAAGVSAAVSAHEKGRPTGAAPGPDRDCGGSGVGPVQDHPRSPHAVSGAAPSFLSVRLPLLPVIGEQDLQDVVRPDQRVIPDAGGYTGPPIRSHPPQRRLRRPELHCHFVPSDGPAGPFHRRTSGQDAGNASAMPALASDWTITLSPIGRSAPPQPRRPFHVTRYLRLAGVAAA